MRYYARFVLFILTIFFGLWFIIAAFIDESPSEDLAQYYSFHQDQTTDYRDNIFVGMLGLYAPEDTDYYLYGQQQITNFGVQAQNQIKLTESLSISDLQCLIKYDDRNFDRDICPPLQSFVQYMKENRVLLERYALLTQLERFDHVIFHIDLYAQQYEGFIHLNKVVLASYAVLLMQGRIDDAVARYNDHIRFIKKLIQAEANFIGFSVAMKALEDLIFFHPYIVNALRRHGIQSTYNIESLAFRMEEYKRIVKSVMHTEIKWFLRHAEASSTGHEGGYNPRRGLKLTESLFDFRNVMLKRMHEMNQQFRRGIDETQDQQSLIKNIRSVVYRQYTPVPFLRNFRDALNPTAYVRANILMNELVRGLALFESFYYQNQMAQLGDFYTQFSPQVGQSYHLVQTMEPVEVSADKLCILNKNGIYLARKCLYTGY